MPETQEKPMQPGVCIPWDDKKQELSEIKGDEEIVKQSWEEIDSFGYMYIWHCLLSF